MVNSFAPAAVGMLVFLITSRVLGPAEFGVVALAASIAALASAIGPVGFGEALVQRAQIGPQHLDTVFWLCFFAAVLIYDALLLSSQQVSSLLGAEELAVLIPVLGLRVIFDLIAAVPNALLMRSMSFKRLAARTTIASLVSAAVCLALLAFGQGLWALALSQLAASVTTAIGSLISARWRPGVTFSLRALRELTRFGVFASTNRAVQTVNLDQLLIGSLLGAAPLGLFNFAKRIFQILSDFIASPLSSVSYPLLSSFHSEPAKLRDAFQFATLASSIVSFPLFVGLALVADDLIPLVFGDHWVGAIVAVRAFCAIVCRDR